MKADPETAIRERRADFDVAIEMGDVETIGSILARNAILVTGTKSSIISGRKAQLLTWKRLFAAPIRTVFTRTPYEILASPAEPIALEHGSWSGFAGPSEGPFVTGVYSAKWREIDSKWLIEAEIFVTLA